jgi:desampylase
MTVRISRALLQRILAHAAETPGEEICGLLFGEPDRVAAIEPAANVAPDPSRHFEVDPARLFAAIRAERAGGPCLVGHYHSHPSGACSPSATDAQAAVEPGRLWLIVAGGEAAAWRERPGGSVQGAFEPVRLVSDDG